VVHVEGEHPGNIRRSEVELRGVARAEGPVAPALVLIGSCSILLAEAHQRVKARAARGRRQTSTAQR
jgi:hypothetical protein